jgi:hypothetical protein
MSEQLLGFVLTRDQMTANINPDTDFTVDIRAEQR